MKLDNYLPLAESQRRVTDTDQANPQCLVFSPRSSNWTFAIETFTRRVFCFHLTYFFLSIAKTNYKVITDPVTSGSKFLLVQKHFAPVQD